MSLAKNLAQNLSESRQKASEGSNDEMMIVVERTTTTNHTEKKKNTRFQHHFDARRPVPHPETQSVNEGPLDRDNSKKRQSQQDQRRQDSSFHFISFL